MAPPAQEKVRQTPVVSQPARTEPEIARQATVAVTPEPQAPERQPTAYQPRQGGDSCRDDGESLSYFPNDKFDC